MRELTALIELRRRVLHDPGPTERQFLMGAFTEVFSHA